MSKSKRNKTKTIGEYMELRPGEPIVLKVFSGHDVLDLLSRGPSSLDEEGQEKVIALQTVMQHATSEKPPPCVICQDVTIFPGLIGYARSASKGPIGAVFVICTACATAADSAEDLRAEIVKALREEELKTSNWAS
jgi:hypothetical protein